MRVEVVKEGGLNCRLKVVVPNEKIEQAYQERLKEVVKNPNVRVPGFRKNKIPLPVLEQRFGATIRRDVISEVMQSSFQQAITDNKIKIAGNPEVKPTEIVPGQDLQFEVAFETLPEIELADFSKAHIDKFSAEVTPADIEYTLDRFRRQQAVWRPADRVATLGDRVKIDFEGFIDGKPFAGGNGKGFHLELGSKQMIQGFEEGLVGAEKGENRNLSVTFPKDYPVAHLSGQLAVFKVKVHEIEEPQLPELNDELAVKAGIKEGGLESLKRKLQEDMEMELKRRLASRLKDDTLNQLIELNPIIPPQSMVEDEIIQLQEIARQQMSQQSGTPVRDTSKTKLPKEPFIQQAQKRVILGLLVGEVAKKLDIRSDKNKVRDKVNDLVAASGYGNPEEMVAWYYQNKRLLSEIETLVLEDEVVNRLIEQAQVTDKSITYQEAFSKNY